MFFGTVRSQFFYRKSWYSPPRHKIFWYPKLFWNTGGFLYEMIRYCETKKKQPKIVLPLPLLCMDVLDTKTFLKHRRVPLHCFSVMWDRKFPTEKRDIPLLSLNFFDNRNFLKHRTVPLRKFFWLWNKKFSTKILDTPPRPTFCPKFFDTRNYWMMKRLPYGISFSALLDKEISTENIDTPFTFLPLASYP